MFWDYDNLRAMVFLACTGAVVWRYGWRRSVWVIGFWALFAASVFMDDLWLVLLESASGTLSKVLRCRAIVIFFSTSAQSVFIWLAMAAAFVLLCQEVKKGEAQ